VTAPRCHDEAVLAFIRERLDDETPWSGVPRPIPRALGIIVDLCEPALARPVGTPDRAWADAIIGTLLIAWADHPQYPVAAPAPSEGP
jgi:hypothetical protein